MSGLLCLENTGFFGVFHAFSSLSPKGGGVDLASPKGSQSEQRPAVVFYISTHLLQKETSLVIAEQDSDVPECH